MSTVADDGIMGNEPSIKAALSGSGRLPWKQIAALFAILVFMPLLIIANYLYIENNLWSTIGMGLFQDWNILSSFLANPCALVLALYACHRYDQYVKRVRDLINRDDANSKRIFDDTASNIDDIVFHGRGVWRLVKFSLVMLSIIYVAYNSYIRYFFSDIYASDFWASYHHPYSYWLATLYALIAWGYVVPLVAFVLLAITAAIWRLTDVVSSGVSINLSILSADQAGGLLPLSRLASSLAYAIIPFQLQLIVYYFWRGMTNIPFTLGASVIALGTIAVFTLPIWLAYSTLRSARDRLIGDVAKLYQAAFNKVIYHKEIEKKDREDLFSELRAYNEIRKHLLELKVWPIDLGIIGRFAASLAVAILPVVLSLKVHL